MGCTACTRGARLSLGFAHSEGSPYQGVSRTVGHDTIILPPSNRLLVKELSASTPSIALPLEDTAFGRPHRRMKSLGKATMPLLTSQGGAHFSRLQLSLACGILLSCVAVDGKSVPTRASSKDAAPAHGSSLGDRKLHTVCGRDLLAALSGGKEAQSIEAARLDELRSCIRPLIGSLPIEAGSLRTPNRQSPVEGSVDKSILNLPLSPTLDVQEVGKQAGSSSSNSSVRKLAGQISYRKSTTVNRVIAPSNGSCSGQTPNGGRLQKLEAGFAELILQPPCEVNTLVRAVGARQGKGGAFRRALGPSHYRFPDCEGSTEARCQLARATTGQRFYKQILNRYFALLFEAIAATAPSVGLPINLSRFDLFHGHFFYAPESERFGILFHAREYPSEDPDAFPVNLGYCQRGSTVRYDGTMNLRNLLWLAPREAAGARALAPGILCALDTRADGILGRELVAEGLQLVHTVYEGDLGVLLGDINYLGPLKKLKVEQRLFIC